MQDWQIIEIIVKKVASVFEMDWKALFENIQPGGSSERRRRILKAKLLVSHCLSRYFAADFIAEFFKCSYQNALRYLLAAKRLIKKEPNYDGIVGHIHYTIKAYDDQWIFDLIAESNNAA